MSETQTASLTDFLLARIAEDEADAGRETWGQPIPGDCWGPDRVLAECEAKRRIVEDFTLADADYRTTRSEADEVRRLAALLAVTRVASVYADHPDFRDEWRP